MTQGGCRSCCPIRFPGRSTTASRPELDPQPGDVVLVPLNRREEIGVVWDRGLDAGGAGQQIEAAGRHHRHAADALRAAPVRRLGGQLHAVAARRSDGDGVAHGRRRARPACDRLAPRRTAARRADDRGAPQGAGRAGATRTARARRTGARRRGQCRRDARHGGRRAAGSRRAADRRRRSRSRTPDIPARSWRPIRQAAAADAARRGGGARILASPCWTASPAPARPRSIWRRSPNACARAARRWCCCRRSRCPRNGWSGSSAASASHRRSGTPT